MKLEKKVALITGGAQGLRKAIALLMVKEYSDIVTITFCYCRSNPPRDILRSIDLLVGHWLPDNQNKTPNRAKTRWSSGPRMRILHEKLQFGACISRRDLYSGIEWSDGEGAGKGPAGYGSSSRGDHGRGTPKGQ